MNLWYLPHQAEFGGKAYPIHADFRDILEIFSYLQNPDLPEFIRWQVALRLFYEEVPEDKERAISYFCSFVQGGREASAGPKLLDWEQDAPVILADVNKVAGQEIRALPFVHWWTFLSWFYGIGDGQLSALVSVRDKLRRGQKLEGWERDFYRQNKQQVDLKKRYSREELRERQALNDLLG